MKYLYLVAVFANAALAILYFLGYGTVSHNEYAAQYVVIATLFSLLFIEGLDK